MGSVRNVQANNKALHIQVLEDNEAKAEQQTFGWMVRGAKTFERMSLTERTDPD